MLDKFIEEELKFTKNPKSFSDSEKLLCMILRELWEIKECLRPIAKGANEKEGD